MPKPVRISSKQLFLWNVLVPKIRPTALERKPSHPAPTSSVQGPFSKYEAESTGRDTYKPSQNFSNNHISLKMQSHFYYLSLISLISLPLAFSKNTTDLPTCFTNCSTHPLDHTYQICRQSGHSVENCPCNVVLPYWMDAASNECACPCGDQMQVVKVAAREWCYAPTPTGFAKL